MIRFVDLGKQLGLDEEWPRQFCFFTTITDTFIKLDGEQVWESWQEFEQALEGDPHNPWNLDRRRLRSLCPPWVFGEDEPAKADAERLLADLGSRVLADKVGVEVWLGTDEYKRFLEGGGSFLDFMAKAIKDAW